MRAAAAPSQVDSVDAANQLMDFGQRQFPELFPGSEATQFAGDIVYRYYPAVGSYLAVTDWQVYVLGGPFGPKIVHVGALTDFITPVDTGAAPCAPATLDWSAGAQRCTALAGRSPSGHAVTLAASNGQAGSARFACSNGRWSAPADTICSTPGRDTRDVASAADVLTRLSVAGRWYQVPGQPGFPVVGPFWAPVRLGDDRREGLVLGGWSFGSVNDPQVTKNNAWLLQQDASGALRDASSELLGDPLINGTGSIVVHDFNGDGRDDIVMMAHNEAPFIGMPSTAYLSRADGRFTKQVLPDTVMDHDAKLLTLDGKKHIVGVSFGGKAADGSPFVGGNPIYTWNGQGFVVETSMFLGGFSILAGDFNGDGTDWLVAGGRSVSPTDTWRNYIFRWAGPAATNGQTPTVLPTPYFNGKPEYDAFHSFGDPYSKTHTSRLWLTDFNQDGRPDIIAGQELWDPTGLHRSVLQMLANQGGLVFKDQTDELHSDYDRRAMSIDYSLRLVDIDASGIDSIIMTGQVWAPSLDTPTGNQFLVNDGTGRHYAVLRNELKSLTSPLITFVLEVVRPEKPDAWVNPTTHPLMLPYRTPDGRLNYLSILAGNFGYLLGVNIPLGINVTTDFRRDLVVSTRNGSKNIRTFAGNDVIHRGLDDPDCRIDGGLGINTVVYPGKRANWIIGRDGTKLTVRPRAGRGTDTLVRVQVARFDDVTVDLNLPE